jgi:helix-turn-helix, Psq domain.
MVMENLKHALTVSRISRIMDIPRSTIYYRKTGRSGTGNPGYLKTLNLK